MTEPMTVEQMDYDDVVSRLQGWGKAYPLDLFGEVTAEEREWLHATKPGLMDRIAAAMGRHMAECIASDVAKVATLAAQVEALQSDNVRLNGAFDDADEKASVHWYGEWVTLKGRDEAAIALLREVAGVLRNGNTEYFTSNSGQSSLNKRIDAHLAGREGDHA